MHCTGSLASRPARLRQTTEGQCRCNPFFLGFNMFEITTSNLRMTSHEIAQLVEKRHDNVKRTIESLANQSVISLPQFEEIKIQRERRAESASAYVFTGEQGKRDSIIVV